MGLGGKWVGGFYGDILSLRNVCNCMLQIYKKQEFSEEEKIFKHVLCFAFMLVTNKLEDSRG